ncbi:MAG: hypothetical protein WBP22_04620 [Candidatus Saccharimonas sp.]
MGVTTVGGNATATATDVAAIIIWPRTLSAAEAAIVRTNARTKFPGLPA